MYYNSLYSYSTNRMALASGRAKKENLNKFQNKRINLFIEGPLDFMLLTPNIQWSCLSNIPGKSSFLYQVKFT